MDIERTKFELGFYTAFCAVAIIGGLILGWLIFKMPSSASKAGLLEAVQKPVAPTAPVAPPEPPLDAKFRYIHSNDGLWAVEVLQPNGTWTIGPSYNTWRTKREAQFDINWWKDKWRIEEEQAKRVWTNSN